MARVQLPVGSAYAWWTSGKDTVLAAKPTLTVPWNTPVKVTVFCEREGIYNNSGTAIFICKRGGGALVPLPLRWPTTTAVLPTAAQLPTTGSILRVEGGSDLVPALWRELRGTAHMVSPASGFDRKIAIDWEWPFPVPGQNGIPELRIPVPGWLEALPWLEWHATSSLGRARFEDCTEDEKKSVVGIALGAVGYLTGYDHEVVDDTSSQYGSMGTGNDCDDFAVAAGAVALAALHGGDTPTTGVHRWIRANVAQVFVVSGMANPNLKKDRHGKPVLIGHMWCELHLHDDSILVVEATAGVAFYGGEPTSSTVRVGRLEEYVSREYYWGARGAHHHRDALRAAKVPTWLVGLSYAPPSPGQDPHYAAPGLPPTGKLVYASVPTRQQHLPAEVTLVKKILPFTKGTVSFALAPVAVDNTAATGSLQ